MVSFIDILKYALTHFYPSSHRSVDGVEYKSLKETYKDWFNSKYYNGYWFINVEEEDIPTVLGTVERSVDDTVYMVYIDSRWYFGVLLKNFGENQTGKCTVYYDNGYAYNASFKRTDSDYVLVVLGSQVTRYNVNRFVFSADEVIVDRIKYNGVSNYVVDDVVEVSYGEFLELKKRDSHDNNAFVDTGSGVDDGVIGTDYIGGVLVSSVLSYGNGRGEYNNLYVNYSDGVLTFN